MSATKDSSKTPDFQKLGHEANQYPQFSLEQCRDLVTDMRRLQASNEYPASLGESDPLRIEWLIDQVESFESTRSRLVEALKKCKTASLPTEVREVVDAALSAAHKGGDK